MKLIVGSFSSIELSLLKRLIIFVFLIGGCAHNDGVVGANPEPQKISSIREHIQHVSEEAKIAGAELVEYYVLIDVGDDQTVHEITEDKDQGVYYQLFYTPQTIGSCRRAVVVTVTRTSDTVSSGLSEWYWTGDRWDSTLSQVPVYHPVELKLLPLEKNQ